MAAFYDASPLTLSKMLEARIPDGLITITNNDHMMATPALSIQQHWGFLNRKQRRAYEARSRTEGKTPFELLRKDVTAKGMKVR